MSEEQTNEEKRKPPTESDRLEHDGSLSQILQSLRLDEKDASSTRVNDDEAAKSSHSKQMDADANEKILGLKGNSKKLLQDFTRLSENAKFLNILRVTELQLAERDEDSAIERLEDFLSKESRSGMDVKNIANNLEEKGHYCQAMILYKISHDLHKNEGKFSPDDELDWIEGRIIDIYQVFIPLIEADGTSRKIAVNLAVKFLKQFLEDIREVKNANTDWRAWVESGCLARIGDVSDGFQDRIRFCDEGLNIMTQQFGENATNYRLYGILLHNLGNAHHYLGRYSDAENFYVSAIEIQNQASDYEREEDREGDIELSEEWLDETRRYIAKPNVNQFREETLDR